MVKQPEKMQRRRISWEAKLKSWPGLADGPLPPHRFGIKKYEYRIAHACFECRKSFKIADYDERNCHKCPECTRPLRFMGRYFKTPKRSDLEQWRKVQKLWNAGFRFDASRDSPRFPLRLKEVDAFIKQNPYHPLRSGIRR